jgi:hypothetical protein
MTAHSESMCASVCTTRLVTDSLRRLHAEDTLQRSGRSTRPRWTLARWSSCSRRGWRRESVR